MATTASSGSASEATTTSTTSSSITIMLLPRMMFLFCLLNNSRRCSHGYGHCDKISYDDMNMNTQILTIPSRFLKIRASPGLSGTRYIPTLLRVHTPCHTLYSVSYSYSVSIGPSSRASRLTQHRNPRLPNNFLPHPRHNRLPPPRPRGPATQMHLPHRHVLRQMAFHHPARGPPRGPPQSASHDQGSLVRRRVGRVQGLCPVGLGTRGYGEEDGLVGVAG